MSPDKTCAILGVVLQNFAVNLNNIALHILIKELLIKLVSKQANKQSSN